MDEFPYRYFVSYAHSQGFGQAEVQRRAPVASYADINEFRNTISSASPSPMRAEEIAVINFILVSQPED